MSVRSSLWSFGGLLLVVLFSLAAHADTAYYQRTFFDNSTTPDSYFYSSGEASAPSTLQLVGKRIPVDSADFFTGPNSLRLEWNSQPKGMWTAELRLYAFRDRVLYFPGDTLSFWLYAPQPLAAANLPQIALKDSGRNFTQPLKLDNFAKDLPAGQWMRVQVPLDRFVSASVGKFEAHLLSRIALVQGRADATPHTLLIDHIKSRERKYAWLRAGSCPGGTRERIRAPH
jgi:hypothetical protein